MDVFTITREAAVEPLQSKSAEAVGQATKWAEERNFVVTTDLGNELASLDRELPEEHRTKRCEDRNATAVIDRGIQTLKKEPHETVYGALEDVERQPATEFRLLQNNVDKFQHNKDLTDRRIKARGRGGLQGSHQQLQPPVWGCRPWTP